MKSHEKTITEAEGLPMGKHRGGAPEVVKGPKHNGTVQKAAMAAHMRRESDGSKETGGDTPSSVSSHYGQGSNQAKEKPGLQKKAHGFNERSVAGNADPEGGW